jgi:hypothetical protein
MTAVRTEPAFRNRFQRLSPASSPRSWRVLLMMRKNSIGGDAIRLRGHFSSHGQVGPRSPGRSLPADDAERRAKARVHSDARTGEAGLGLASTPED